MDLNRIKEILALKLGQTKKIVTIDSLELPPMGVNSVMLKVKVTVQDQNGKEHLLHLVAKSISAEKIKETKLNNVDFFMREVTFYEEILPVLKVLEKEEGIKKCMDTFAEYYGASYIEGKDEFGLILLEDIAVKGFSNGDRKAGLDLKHAEQILHDLARFHGTSIALASKKPDVFDRIITSYCSNFSFSSFKDKIEVICNSLGRIIQSFPEYSHVAHYITTFPGKHGPSTRYPFGTIIHFDCWVNNIMNKVTEDGEVKNVFVDFQIFDYKSAASDVFFFLWTSVNMIILKDNIDNLLHHYYQNLENTLKDFKIDISKFKFEEFEKEIAYQSKEFEFGHAMLFKSFLLKETLKDFKPDLDQVTPELKEFMKFMLTECLKRGWI